MKKIAVNRKYCGDQNKMARKNARTHTRIGDKFTRTYYEHISNEMNEIERVEMETPTQPTSVSENLYLESKEKKSFFFHFHFQLMK